MWRAAYVTLFIRLSQPDGFGDMVLFDPLRMVDLVVFWPKAMPRPASLAASARPRS